MKALGIIYLTPHFKLSEMCHSDTASCYGWDNFPDWDALINLNHLAHRLEHVREIVKSPIYVSSGYRSLKLNSFIDGAENSYHLYGRAADIYCNDMALLRDALEKFDWTELIDCGTFIHVAL